MLTVDKFAIEMIVLMRGGRGGAQGGKFCLQTLPIQKGFAWVVATVRAEHLVREGTEEVDNGCGSDVDRAVGRVWS